MPEADRVLASQLESLAERIAREPVQVEDAGVVQEAANRLRNLPAPAQPVERGELEGSAVALLLREAENASLWVERHWQVELYVGATVRDDLPWDRVAVFEDGGRARVAQEERGKTLRAAAALVAKAPVSTQPLLDLDAEEKAILETLLRREWESHTQVNPEVRKHLDKIEALIKKLAAYPERPADDLDAEQEAINESGFDEVLKLREELEAMTDARARDLCKRQTAQANERLEKTRECWRHEKERADAAQGELDRERRRKDVGRDRLDAGKPLALDALKHRLLAKLGDPNLGYDEEAINEIEAAFDVARDDLPGLDLDALKERLTSDEVVEELARARWDRGWIDPDGEVDWDGAKRLGIAGVAAQLKVAREDLLAVFAAAFPAAFPDTEGHDG